MPVPSPDLWELFHAENELRRTMIGVCAPKGKTAQPSAPNFVDFPIRGSASSLRFGRLSLLFDQFSMKARKV